EKSLESFVQKRGEGIDLLLSQEQQILGHAVVLDVQVDAAEDSAHDGTGLGRISSLPRQPFEQFVPQPFRADGQMLPGEESLALEVAADRALDALAGDA